MPASFPAGECHFGGDGQPASNTFPAGGAHANVGSGDYFLSFV